MKHTRWITGFIAVLLLPILFGGQVFADTISITQEISVTAVVPAHRDIVLDNAGRIIEITSNTTNDVTPDAYRFSAAPENKISLSSDLLAAYRTLVPAGTTRTGVLYKQSPVAVVSKNAISAASPAATSPIRRHTPAGLSFLYKPASAS